MITSCRLSRSPNLVLAGSLVIMANLNENVMAPTEMIAKCSADQGGITLRSGPTVKKGARSAIHRRRGAAKAIFERCRGGSADSTQLSSK